MITDSTGSPDHAWLENKTAVIYAAAGASGGAVARAFAREGARLFLTGRNVVKVDAVAKEIVLLAASLRQHKLTLLTTKPWRSTSTPWSREREVLTSRSTPSARAPRPTAYP